MESFLTRYNYWRRHYDKRHAVQQAVHQNLMTNHKFDKLLSMETRGLADRLAKKAQLKKLGYIVSEAKKSNEYFNGHYTYHDVVREINNIPNFAYSVDWRDFFSIHFSLDVYFCNDCDTLDFCEDGHNVEDDYTVCRDCVNEYYYSDRRGYYCHEEDNDYDDDYDNDDGNGLIGSYHSSKRRLGHIPSSYDNRKPRVLLGLELEMEVSESISRYDVADNVLSNIGKFKNYQYALLENDGSLSHGFEMVTSYTGLDVHAKQLQFFKNPLKHAKSHNTSSCGLHVHICKSDMTTLHASKMVLFINDTNNKSLVECVARRTEAHYARFKDKAGDKSWLKDSVRDSKIKVNQLCNLNSDRYEALNFQNQKTIEFRLFKGSLKYQTIMSCLEFTYATWFFCRESSVNELTTENFLKFICRNENRADTKHLRLYLRAKGFDLPEKIKLVQSNVLPKAEVQTLSIAVNQ
jgi:Putative amidoligase enzyme